MAWKRRESVEQPPVPRAADESADGQTADAICMSVESVELFKKLKGDVASIRGTILAAFQESEIDGLQTLTAACLLVDDVTLCKRLLAVFTELGRFGMLRMPVIMQLMTIAAYGPGAEVQETAAEMITKLQGKCPGLDFLGGPQFTKSALKRVCSMIEEATAVNPAQDDGSQAPPAPAEEPSPSLMGRKKSATGDKRRRGRRVVHSIV